MAINIRRGGIGRSILVGQPVFSIQKKLNKPPLDVEVQLANDVLNKVLPPKSTIDSLLVAGSLPRAHKNLFGASLARLSGATFGGITEFSGGCTSVVDAMHYLFCSAASDEYHALVVADSFFSSYGASSGGMEWADGAAGLFASPNGSLRLKLKAYASSFRPEFIEMAHDVGGELKIPFSPRYLSSFASADEETIHDLLQVSLDFAGLTLSDLSCVIASNRSTEALHRVERACKGQVRIFESRSKYSHSGGSDTLINLSLALDAMRQGIFCLLSFGLGYSWRIMILEVTS